MNICNNNNLDSRSNELGKPIFITGLGDERFDSHSESKHRAWAGNSIFITQMNVFDLNLDIPKIIVLKVIVAAIKVMLPVTWIF